MGLISVPVSELLGFSHNTFIANMSIHENLQRASLNTNNTINISKLDNILFLFCFYVCKMLLTTYKHDSN